MPDISWANPDKTGHESWWGKCYWNMALKPVRVTSQYLNFNLTNSLYPSNVLKNIYIYIRLLLVLGHVS